jgi:ribosomal protein L11 methyltransferase
LKWLKVSIKLSGELAEPVSDLLTQHISGGIALEATPAESDMGGEIEVTLHTYLPADDELERKQKVIEEGLWHLSQIQEIPQPSYEWVDEQDWEEAWKRHYHPITVGERLVIQPAWMEVEHSNRIPLMMDPGMAFGTGTHPTTQLCLKALENSLKAGESVIDLGCGSGILSIAAARLGASHVIALDIDPIAVQNTRENGQRNGVEQLISVHQGSLDLLLSPSFSDRIPTDLLLANILAKTLEDMLLAGLGDAISPNGTMVLSGILDHQVSSIEACCQDLGLSVVEILRMQDWRALIVKQMPPSS